ncbi:disulfide bond formation protein DsbA [Candidatus Peregrinibacteria bacterium]|nr:MAG: disulfide bond formation protein DsbA [Candidatus Peregrinibacteria bacterium]
MKNNNTHLIFAIVFASVLIAASLVFAAGVYGYINYYSTGDSSQGSFSEKMEQYIAAKQGEEQARQLAAQKRQEEATKGVRPIDATDHVQGDRDAKISIIEYSDYECPFCKRNHPTVQKVVNDYKGVVNWAYRHLPLEFHDPNATDQAEATECVAVANGNAAFWIMNGEIFERTKSNKSFPFKQLEPLVKELGFDVAKYNACMKSNETLSIINQHKVEAAALGISGTPANILRNNETGEVRFLPGAYPYEAFEAVIEEWK